MISFIIGAVLILYTVIHVPTLIILINLIVQSTRPGHKLPQSKQMLLTVMMKHIPMRLRWFAYLIITGIVLAHFGLADRELIVSCFLWYSAILFTTIITKRIYKV